MPPRAVRRPCRGVVARPGALRRRHRRRPVLVVRRCGRRAERAQGEGTAVGRRARLPPRRRRGAARGSRPRRRGGDGGLRAAVRARVRGGPARARRVPARVQRLGRRVQRRRPRPPRRARDAPGAHARSRGGRAAAGRRARAPRRGDGLLRSRRSRRSRTSGTTFWAVANDVGYPDPLPLERRDAQYRVRGLAAAGRGRGEPDAARRGARRDVVLRDLRATPEREARARRVWASDGCRTSSTVSTTSSTSTATRPRAGSRRSRASTSVATFSSPTRRTTSVSRTSTGSAPTT